MVDVVAQRGQVEATLAAERLVETAAMHAKMIDQVVDGRAVVTAPREQLHGRTDHLLLVEPPRPAHA
jgi:hypothetical protein